MNYHKKSAKLILSTILILSISSGIYAAEGDLDTTFDGDGIVITDDGTTGEILTDLAIQQDGKIVAIWYRRDPSTTIIRVVIVRYNSDGTIDSSFGSNGSVIITSVYGFQSKLALQPDGKILVATSKDGDVFVARLNPDGSYDTEFNGTGIVTFDLRGTGAGVNSVIIQPDGKILLGGGSVQPTNPSIVDFAITRLNANGSLDTTFGSDGKIFTTIQDIARVLDLAVQTDGKILAVGESFFVDKPNNNIYGSFATVRYSSDGLLDITFNGTGIDLTEFDLNVTPGARTSNTPNKILLRERGRILVVGTTSSTTRSEVAMIQYNSNGSVDSSFGNQGKAQAAFSLFSMTSARDAAIQSDNKIVVTGGHGAIKVAPRALIGRFNSDGSLDTTLNGTGWNRFDFPVSESSKGHAIAIQQDGKTVIGGEVRQNGERDSFLARFITTDCQINCPIPGSIKMFDFDGDGRTDASIFRNDSWFIQPTSANNTSTFYSVELGEPNDKLVPADYDGDGKTDVAVWRENVSGNQSFFYIMLSETNTLFTYQFGNTGDDPGVVGDWDGDEKADLAVYRQAANAGEQSLYYYIPSSAVTPFFVVIPWGTSEDGAVRGDYDGDGKLDAAVYRPSNGVWYVLNSSNNQPTYTQWGIATDIRTTGDFDGDGKSDLVIFRDGVWYVLQSSNNQPRYEYWGLDNNYLVPGDYDGDGLTDFAVWKDGLYYILQNSDSQVVYQQFGASGDIPVASAFAQ